MNYKNMVNSRLLFIILSLGVIFNSCTTSSLDKNEISFLRLSAKDLNGELYKIDSLQICIDTSTYIEPIINLRETDLHNFIVNGFDVQNIYEEVMNSNKRDEINILLKGSKLNYCSFSKDSTDSVTYRLRFSKARISKDEDFAFTSAILQIDNNISIEYNFIFNANKIIYVNQSKAIKVAQ